MSDLPITLVGDSFAVSTEGVSKRYKNRTALHNVSLQVPEGSVYLLVGENGAGKSTAIKLLLDLIRADAGKVEVFGLNVLTSGPHIRANIGYVPEIQDWGYDWMTAGRLLQHHSRYFPSWDAKYAAQLIGKFSIELDSKMSTLSKGEARRVHLVMALAHRPRLLLLDEPTDGIDPIMRDELLGVLVDHLSESPTTMLLSTHHVEEVEKLADHIGVLRNGNLKAQVSLDNMRANLRRYRLEVPEQWGGVSKLDSSVLVRNQLGRETQLTVWGNEAEVLQQLTASEAVVHDVLPVSLIDATLAFLKQNGRNL